MVLGCSYVCRKKAGPIWFHLDPQTHMLSSPTIISKRSHSCISLVGMFQGLKRSGMTHDMYLLNIDWNQLVSFCFGLLWLSAHHVAPAVWKEWSIVALSLVKFAGSNAQGWLMICIYLTYFGIRGFGHHLDCLQTVTIAILHACVCLWMRLA